MNSREKDIMHGSGAGSRGNSPRLRDVQGHSRHASGSGWESDSSSRSDSSERAVDMKRKLESGADISRTGSGHEYERGFRWV
jgi:hypothetical protein